MDLINLRNREICRGRIINRGSDVVEVLANFSPLTVVTQKTSHTASRRYFLAQ